MVLGDTRPDHCETHLHAPLLRQIGKGQANSPVLDPTHLGRDDAAVKQLQRQALTDVRRVWENNHGTGGGDVHEANHVAAPAKLQHGGAGHRAVPRLRAFVDPALLTARDLEYRLRVSEASAVVTDAEGAEKIDAISTALSSLSHRILVSDTPRVGWLDYKALLASAAGSQPHQ